MKVKVKNEKELMIWGDFCLWHKVFFIKGAKWEIYWKDVHKTLAIVSRGCNQLQLTKEIAEEI